MKIKYLLTFTIFFSILFLNDFDGVAFAQNRNIDSLLILLKTDKPDSNKVNHLNDLTREYINIREYDTGLKYGNKALALSSSLPAINKQGWLAAIANAFNNIGNINYYKNFHYEALKKHYAALKIRKDIGDKKGIAASHYSIALIHQSQCNYPEALKNNIAALKIWEAMDDKKGMAKNYNCIGNIYFNQANFTEALKNHFAALKLKLALEDKPGIANSYINIGNVYYGQGNLPEALKNYSVSLLLSQELGNHPGIASSYQNIGAIYEIRGNHQDALKNFFASLKVNKEINDKIGIASCYHNIATTYTSMGDYRQGLKNYYASLKLKEEIGDKQGIASSLFNLGLLQIELQKHEEANDYLIKALQVYKEINSKAGVRNSYKLLSGIDSTKGNWKEAYENHKLFIVYRDSIDNEETKKKTTEIILTNKFEKQEAATKAAQEKKDTIATANKKRQQLILILVSSVLILVFIFAGFVVRSLRITNKQKKTIELQKNEVSLQKEIVSEKNKEITDSINYAQRIQRALLASKKMLDANLSKSGHGSVSEDQEMLGQVQHNSSYFIFFQPKDIVSGDFYWASPLANGNFALVTADSTGHGVPGAIMSMLNISCLNEAVKAQQLTEPNEILDYTRKKIIEHLSNDGSAEGGKDGMDCSLLSFEFGERSSVSGEGTSEAQSITKLTYSAANNPIWIVRKKQIIELELDKMPVGKHNRDSIPFTRHSMELEKGDIVYTISDGMPDQFGGPKGKKFMSKQLKELLVRISHFPMQEQKEKLSHEFNLWKGNLEQVDDVTILGICI